MKKATFILVTAILVGLGVLSVTAQDQCTTLIDSADALHDAFRIQEALQVYEKAYNMCPNRYETLMKYTRELNNAGEEAEGDQAKSLFEQSLKHADKMVSQYPDSMMSHFLIAASAGNLALHTGGRRKVELSRTIEASAKKAIQLDSTYAPSYVILGQYYFEVATASSFLKTIGRLFFGDLPEGSLQDALNVLQKALELEPDNIYGHLAIARTYLELDQTQKAVSHLEKIQNIPITDHQHEELKKTAQQLLSSVT